jgi:hypothetical protein
MLANDPPNASDVRQMVGTRLAALEALKGAQETVTVEWRSRQIHIPVISMPVDLLHYNPDTHRVRAQRSIDPGRERHLSTDPYGSSAQDYLHLLLKSDPTEPSKVDPSFIALKEDLSQHGQSDPGIITRSGVLINGNTRRAALKELGQDDMRVGVLPTDAGHEDLQSIELSLQLRKDHKREYSFMNLLLAIDERVRAGKPAAVIQNDFRIKAATFDRNRWIMGLVDDAIERSTVPASQGAALSLHYSDFETDQGKLEELFRAYRALARKSPDDADALRETRLLALVLSKSKTDLRLIEPDFVKRYMSRHLPTPTAPAAVRIPGTSIVSPGPNQEVQALRQLATSALKARSIQKSPTAATPEQVSGATTLLGELGDSMVKALDHAGKQARVVQRRIAAVERVSDASDDLALAVGAVAEARATGNFDSDDLDEVLMSLRTNLEKLAAIVVRGSDGDGEGTRWLRALAGGSARGG